MQSIRYKSYYDKVLGGWIGKCAGGILGAPIEGFKRFNDIELSDSLFDKNYPNDDLDLQVLWLEMVKQKGPYVRESDFGEFWKKHVQFPWCEYGIAGRNLKLGLHPPDSGRHNNPYWSTGMGSPIRSEIWGMLNPGMPAQAAYYAGMDSSLDHDGFSVDAERFLSALAAIAFFNNDIADMFVSAASIFNHQCPFTDLLDYVIKLNDTCSYDIAIHKMKSSYGDADFTNAPMNVGFILLALLYNEPHFDNLIKAVRLGHDSDCIAATVGALYGIIKGASKIDPKWRKLVGDELLVSPEIVDIDHAATLTGLAEETCRAGLNFTAYFEHTQVVQSTAHPFNFEHASFSVNTLLLDYQPSLLADKQELEIEYENLTEKPQVVVLKLSSQYLEFRESHFEFTVEGMALNTIETLFSLSNSGYENLTGELPEAIKPALAYNVHVTIDGAEQKIKQCGLPFYGTWLLLGPFIADDPILAPMDPEYPDHGLSSLPSCEYMNHDKLDSETEHLAVAQARKIAKEQNFQQQPFEVQPINPDAFKMNLNDYFNGRGEKTLYLYCKVFSPEAKDVWLAIGCSSYIRVWWNGTEVFKRSEIRRSWPYDIAIKAALHAGENDIFIRIDAPLDDIQFEFGLKEYVGKHPHQSQWDAELTPYI